jgi:drug/metabolite transporter (DMT)-like permease
VQYAAAAVVLLALASATESMTVRWTPQLLAALVWLVLVLSLGVVLLLLLLRRGSASSVLYLVPPRGRRRGVRHVGERLAPLSVLGIAVVASRRPRSLRTREAGAASGRERWCSAGGSSAA